ncbi:hypothetical protein EVAR_14089_1 [Eumeta japonica]|uniref:Uncharacterized protein n=1 Tax=Eumeta variegata TaxID=151549 RepID=A0A4C1UNW8_EUMVA|nr:hypothetical protein EVAR_14089_1 [Eumeta japonica]
MISKKFGGDKQATVSALMAYIHNNMPGTEKAMAPLRLQSKETHLGMSKSLNVIYSLLFSTMRHNARAACGDARAGRSPCDTTHEATRAPAPARVVCRRGGRLTLRIRLLRSQVYFHATL